MCPLDKYYPVLVYLSNKMVLSACRPFLAYGIDTSYRVIEIVEFRIYCLKKGDYNVNVGKYQCR